VQTAISTAIAGDE